MNTSCIDHVAWMGNMKWRERSPYACSLLSCAFWADESLDSLIQQMNYTPALIPPNTAAIINAAGRTPVRAAKVSLGFSTFHIVSPSYAKLQFTRFDANCNFPTPALFSPNTPLVHSCDAPDSFKQYLTGWHSLAPVRTGSRTKCHLSPRKMIPEHRLSRHPTGFVFDVRCSKFSVGSSTFDVRRSTFDGSMFKVQCSKFLAHPPLSLSKLL
jgi:hypothetical protein